MALEYDSEKMLDKYGLTPEQIKACKKVYKSFREANKLGVKFWDMYGTLSAYNGRKICGLHMHDIGDGCIQVVNSDGDELIYQEQLPNFQAGCADDNVWAELR